MTTGSTNDEGFLVCTLPAPELASRRAETQRLVEQAVVVNAEHDGVLMKFRNTHEIAHALIDFIRFEQQCCSTMTYELRSEPGHTELALQLRAPAAMVGLVQKFYLPGTEDGVQQDAVSKGDVFRTSWLTKNALVSIKFLRSGLNPMLCALLCAFMCLGLPVVSGTLGLAGLSFLKDDRLLIPFEVVCCGAFLWTFERGRQVHGRRAAVWLALMAALLLLGSMFLDTGKAEATLLAAGVVLSSATALDRRFLRHQRAREASWNTLRS